LEAGLEKNTFATCPVLRCLFMLPFQYESVVLSMRGPAQCGAERNDLSTIAVANSVVILLVIRDVLVQVPADAGLPVRVVLGSGALGIGGHMLGAW
jgi:hypothetical protein